MRSDCTAVIQEIHRENPSFVIPEVAKQLGVTESTVYKALNRLGISRSKNMTETEKQRISSAYRSGRKLWQVARKSGRSVNTIKSLLEDRGEYCPRETKKPVEDYFDRIDSADKAYFAGLLYADGSTYRTVDGFTIGLKQEDGELVSRLSLALYGIDHSSIRQHSNRDGCNRQPQRHLTVYSERLAKALYSMGMVPAKSLVLRPPTCDFGPHLRDFVRGFFDGNGCISSYLQKDDRLRVDISFNSTQPMCEWIGGILSGIGATMRIVPHANISRVKTSSYAALHAIYEYLYRGADISLPRKKRRFEELMAYQGTR